MPFSTARGCKGLARKKPSPSAKPVVRQGAKPRSHLGTTGYEASRIGRRLRGWVAERRTINALLAAGGEQLRARARQLCRENPYASAACESFSAAAVGAGIKPSSLVEDADLKKVVQKAWLRWTDEADADGLTDLYGLQALAARAMFEAGEVFIRFRQRRLSDGLSVPLQIQLYESEMLAYTLNIPAVNGNIIREGIEFDAIGRRVAYHFYRSHPGEVFPSSSTSASPACRHPRCFISTSHCGPVRSGDSPRSRRAWCAFTENSN